MSVNNMSRYLYINICVCFELSRDNPEYPTNFFHLLFQPHPLPDSRVDGKFHLCSLRQTLFLILGSTVILQTHTPSTLPNPLPDSRVDGSSTDRYSFHSSSTLFLILGSTVFLQTNTIPHRSYSQPLCPYSQSLCPYSQSLCPFATFFIIFPPHAVSNNSSSFLDR
jgi:hypothetical protein